MEEGRIRVEVDGEHFFTYSYSSKTERYSILVSAFEEAVKMYAMEPGIDLVFDFTDMEPEEE